MKYDKFFALAKEKGIQECDLNITESYSLSFSLFHGEVDDYQNNNGYSIIARGLVNGKFGTAVCDAWDSKKAEFLVNEILANAKVIEDEDPMFIFKGSEKYHKINPFNKELHVISIDEKLRALHELEKAIKEGDKRISEVASVSYSEKRTTFTLLNSHGLKLSQKINYFFVMGQAVAKERDQVKSGFDYTLGNDFSKFDIKGLAKDIIKSATEQLGGEACKSGEYKTVLANNVVADLVGAYVSSADAEEVQKHTSLFAGKLGQKIASSKLTIEDKPMAKTLFSRYFDDEGVATYNKPIIKNGVLQTYLYNLTTAAKENRESTGNASNGGGKMGVSPTYLFVKPGKKTLDEIFQEIGDGVYITDVQGLHSGLDPQTGNFSLQANGFLVKNGKKDHALDVITVSGNLMKLFNDVTCVASNIKTFASAISCPSVLVKKLAIGGK